MDISVINLKVRVSASRLPISRPTEPFLRLFQDVILKQSIQWKLGVVLSNSPCP